MRPECRSSGRHMSQLMPAWWSIQPHRSCSSVVFRVASLSSRVMNPRGPQRARSGQPEGERRLSRVWYQAMPRSLHMSVTAAWRWSSVTRRHRPADRQRVINALLENPGRDGDADRVVPLVRGYYPAVSPLVIGGLPDPHRGMLCPCGAEAKEREQVAGPAGLEGVGQEVAVQRLDSPALASARDPPERRPAVLRVSGPNLEENVVVCLGAYFLVHVNRPAAVKDDHPVASGVLMPALMTQIQ